MLLGSAGVKAACRSLVKLALDLANCSHRIVLSEIELEMKKSHIFGKSDKKAMRAKPVNFPLTRLTSRAINVTLKKKQEFIGQDSLKFLSQFLKISIA